MHRQAARSVKRHGFTAQEPALAPIRLLELGQVRQHLFLARPTLEIQADHFIGPQRRLASRPHIQEHASDDGTIRLKRDAIEIGTQQMPAAQNLLEKSKENLEAPARNISRALRTAAGGLLPLHKMIVFLG
jgi:hypothetical protein